MSTYFVLSAMPVSWFPIKNKMITGLPKLVDQPALPCLRLNTERLHVRETLPLYTAEFIGQPAILHRLPHFVLQTYKADIEVSSAIVAPVRC